MRLDDELDVHIESCSEGLLFLEKVLNDIGGINDVVLPIKMTM